MRVGERVVCVKAHQDSECPLKVNSIYYVLDMDVCKCKRIAFDVGIKLSLDWKGVRCRKCREIVYTNIWWISSHLFRPIQYNSATEELANKEIVEETSDIPVKEPKKEKV